VRALTPTPAAQQRIDCDDDEQQQDEHARGLISPLPPRSCNRQPGFLEMDLVAQCGWNAAGQFLCTLSMVDMATGWVACAGLRDRR
jgi:hypothetical protein